MQIHQSIDSFVKELYHQTMIPRTLESSLRQAASFYPVVSLTGPRQSGKTTLLRTMWPDKSYVSLEDPDFRQFAVDDPRGFLARGGSAGLIIDEAQRHPPLFNYLQGYADNSAPGRFILSGSNNFLLMESISQSLAGRTAVLTLLPFSASEIAPSIKESSWQEIAWKGFYPRPQTSGMPIEMFARDYIATFVERDIRLIKNITNLGGFRRFVQLCAGRAGQLLNQSTLAADAGISVNTCREWLSLLQAAWIIALLPPWHENFNKRITKAPKLYWYDTGLLCSLLDIHQPSDLDFHPLRGAIFENLFIADRYKQAYYAGVMPQLYFWRDSGGIEIDLVESFQGKTRLWECKSGQTIGSDFFKALETIGAKAGIPASQRMVVYGGTESQSRSNAQVIGWKDALCG